MKDDLFKRLTKSILLEVVLAICICMSSIALVWETADLNDNLFDTGNISIDLNGNRQIIHENDRTFGPGSTLEKEFYIVNNSSDDIYYKLFFTNIKGSLADDIEVTIAKHETVLYNGLISDLNSEEVKRANDVLKAGERRILRIEFYYTKDSDNSTQGAFISFDLAASAVQTKNNPSGLFF